MRRTSASRWRAWARFARNSALAFAAGLAATSEAAPNALAKLADTGEVSCQPALPFFCDNIHVSCSGPSTLKAVPFKLRAVADRGSIEPASDPAGLGELYRDSRVDWASDKSYLLLRPARANGYIKLQADGKYSFRHYAQDAAATMSRGHCE
jgi:hypothetical protein